MVRSEPPRPREEPSTRHGDENELPTRDQVDDYEREATELTAYQGEAHPVQAGNTDDAEAVDHFFPVRPQRDLSGKLLWYHPVSQFWRHYVNLAVPHAECRDHLANERTFLSYLRTSLSLSTIGVTVSQLLRLQPSSTPPAALGYFVLSKPLGALFQAAALVLLIVGAHRTWRQQMSMARGKVWASGWEIYVVMAILFVLTSCLLALVVTADVMRHA